MSLSRRKNSAANTEEAGAIPQEVRYDADATVMGTTFENFLKEIQPKAGDRQDSKFTRWFKKRKHKHEVPECERNQARQSARLRYYDNQCRSADSRSSPPTTSEHCEQSSGLDSERTINRLRGYVM